jgi:hypothetical protein
MYGGEEEFIQGFGGENWGKETTWKTPAEMGGSGMGVMDWIDLARDRYRWRALGNAIIILRVP